MTQTDPEQKRRLKDAIAKRAAGLGFDICRIVSPDATGAAAAGLDTWLAEGAHGTMDWMADTAARRRDPRVLWPQVRSIVMLGMNYGPQADPLAALVDRHRAAISVYARNGDYHDVMKGRLKTLAQWLQSATAARLAGLDRTSKPAVKVFVDTAPVMEKPLAAAAGIGWQGKHTNLVSREFGSWLFLGSVFTTMLLEPDTPEQDACGSCRACLDICPTGAFPGPYKVDARRCISYLTIEHRGHIAAEFRTAMGNRIYGCDDCLAACPWNKFAQTAREMRLVARDDLNAPDLSMLLQLDERQFRDLFSRSPIKRIGIGQFIRNVLIAAGNSGDAALLPLIEARLGDEAAIVRAMAVWAVGQLADASALQTLASKYQAGECDSTVNAEWQVALAGSWSERSRV